MTQLVILSSSNQLINMFSYGIARDTPWYAGQFIARDQATSDTTPKKQVFSCI